MLTITFHEGSDPYYDTVEVKASRSGFSGDTILGVGIAAIRKLADDIAGFPRLIHDVRRAELGREHERNRLIIRLACSDSLGSGGAVITIQEGREHPLFLVTLSMPVYAWEIDAFVAQLRNIGSEGRAEATVGEATPMAEEPWTRRWDIDDPWCWQRNWEAVFGQSPDTAGGASPG